MIRREHLDKGVTLYCGDCRERRKPWGKTPIKSVVACRGCDWTWMPSSGFGSEPCPKCGKVRSVRDRNYEGKKNIASLKTAVRRKRSSGEQERIYRRRAALLVGRGELMCVKCGCDRPELLEINHKDGGGGKEHRAAGNKFYRQIANMMRAVDDLELLCRPCNAVHYLETKHGPLPFKIVWGDDAN